ncbi:FAD-dependent oxidoreductase [Lentibacillus cibarius]|uniref:FAD-dependent monooxygenase n=1 Tax=Lentibacillus cibarius TaxID=2583219 RepID=A0A5S3QID5_9BACI|nr:NAD(P)/FAD-dependent oxidoreductase [Lentibacillus cibarius]TMN21674.1 FAD-dependent monooxygenase [Lentibacillus cibarius]
MKRPTEEPSTGGSAVIVGASLSGLMTGIALARVGLQVTILEKAGEQRPTGAGLQVDGGLFDRTKTATLLRKLASGGKKSIQLWSSIESSLRTEAQSYSSIDIHFNTRVEMVDQDDDAAWVVTDTGETVRGDMVVGADGHRSLVRRHVAPHKPDATFAGYMVWFAAINENDLPEHIRPDDHDSGVTMLQGINGGFFFGSVMREKDGTSGSGDRRVGCTFYDNTRTDLLRQLGCVEGTVVKHSLKGADIPEQTLNELAEQASVRWPEPWLSTTLHAIETRDLTGIPIKEYVPDQLVKGRIALVGDAGHVPAPITASGFNESLNDAAELGKCVAKGVQGHAALKGLEKYESARLEKVRQMVQSGQFFGMSYGRS